MSYIWNAYLILEDEGGVDGLLVLEEVVRGLYEEVVRRLHPDLKCDNRWRYKSYDY